MKFLNNLNIKTADIFKIAGIALLTIIVITIGYRLVTGSFSSHTAVFSAKNILPQAMPMVGEMEMAMYDTDMVYGSGGIALSTRNVAVTEPGIPPMDGGTVGDDAEEYEVTSYNANIETRHLSETCEKISSLKSREDVIFENANESDRNCNYYFKVKIQSVPEVLTILESLNPRDLNENKYTIKPVIDDYTSEEEILKKKLDAIEETLGDAIVAYDDISGLATRTQDVESLAKIIDSKIKIIERLTQERISINAQLERLGRSKAEQTDRLEYTYFSVYVSENKFVDGQDLKDAWKYAVKSFVRDINSIAQDITINLITLLFAALQYVIYFFIVVFIVKYVWKYTKKIWNK